MTYADKEILWLAYGNPTRNSRRFREVIVGRFRNKWRHQMIAGRNVKRADKMPLQIWNDTYGDDSDSVGSASKESSRAPAAHNSFPSDLVEAARKR